MQVFIFGAARTNSKLATGGQQLVLEKLIRGQRVLDWTINAINQAGITSEQISFIGGYKIDKIISKYPGLHYIVNPRWAETHVVGSLRCALDSWKGGDLLLTYADTVFRHTVFDTLLQYNSPVTIGIDRAWRERLEQEYLQAEAEKVLLENGRVKALGRHEIPPVQADAQFSGLVLLKKNVVRKICDLLVDKRDAESPVSDQGSLTELLQIIRRDWEIPIITHDHSGSWAELDTQADLAQFVFGTKAETLDRIQPLVTKAEICEQVHFPLKHWEQDHSSVLNRIQAHFPKEELIIRSSSLEEDSWESSQAGAFLSVAGIESEDNIALEEGIDQVITGFRQNGSGCYDPNNQVLVQPFISDVAMSGVAFSKHLENGTPYYLVNYDDVSRRTDTVTSGTSPNSKSVTIYKKAESPPEDQRIARVIEAVKELETITGYQSLDIEFVLTETGELYIVQVRPITTHNGIPGYPDFHQRIERAKQKVASRLKPIPHIFGDRTVLADMPDWNPAEMIGVRPKPLTVSLYQYLITDSTWRIARSRMGYNNPSPEKLMYCIGGHPYIDVRNSFNNLIPGGLGNSLSEKLVNHYIERLKEQPQLHDKIEFEIAITCYSPDIDEHLKRLPGDQFDSEEIVQLKDILRKLTEDAITGNSLSVEELVGRTESLNPRREALLDTDYEISEIPSLVNTLLDDCIERGTIPFSILARYGFIASSMLRGLVRCGAISNKQHHKFLNSIETVAGNLVETMDQVLAGRYPKEKFLQEFGHLRPGTYDITSYSYAEKPGQYFPDCDVRDRADFEDQSAETGDSEPFRFGDEMLNAIQDEIKQMGMDFSARELLNFIEKATATREYAKFQFTKNLSKALNLLAEWGEAQGFSREDLSYMFIKDILRLDTFSIGQSATLYMKQKIQEGKRWHKESNKIETPQIIASPRDLDIIEHNVAEPNYVTNKSMTAPICRLSKIADKQELEGKIVLTEGADPGYDWIFLHPIKGLITKYGGAASHMTIRCAEFGLPAAIGCGEHWFERLNEASNVELNCSNKQIKVLG
ncbi:PEP-utilizing enzyme [Aliifodinibius sp. S!AR15-10]|uniref:PEP-utilizing enzyme n=1 Tax=Aliifodinibius sp. S!AR15-10 TaxID=2950437 RepID=UPI002865BC8F|nr:PEP-utilizing enzyme [Aliifodinibius sp. S!AR15-10]MDR8393038.1 PEP-utilizing enzyme [Aliifodinibius sp. S!AR15-10]